jgi:hypothetical protein
MPEDALEPTEVDAPKECKLCERIGGILGLAIGAILIFISVDILTGGELSNLISGGLAETTDE